MKKQFYHINKAKTVQKPKRQQQSDEKTSETMKLTLASSRERNAAKNTIFDTSELRSLERREEFDVEELHLLQVKLEQMKRKTTGYKEERLMQTMDSD
jgi:hypothetical protein